MTTNTAPFSLQAFPLVARASHGPAHETVTIRNLGTKELSVTASTKDLHGQCANLKFQPAHFALMPGHSQNVTVTAPAGDTDYLAAFSGTISHGGFGVGAAVGTRLIIGHPTTASICTAPKAAPQPTAHAGFPVWGFALIALVIVVATVFVVRHIWRHAGES